MHRRGRRSTHGTGSPTCWRPFRRTAPPSGTSSARIGGRSRSTPPPGCRHAFKKPLGVFISGRSARPGCAWARRCDHLGIERHAAGEVEARSRPSHPVGDTLEEVVSTLNRGSPKRTTAAASVSKSSIICQILRFFSGVPGYLSTGQAHTSAPSRREGVMAMLHRSATSWRLTPPPPARTTPLRSATGRSPTDDLLS